jgi:small subunit ribosomal protein S20
MANHKSTKKRIKTAEVKRLRNKYYHKSARTAIRKLREMEDKTEAESFLPKVVSTIDLMVKRNVFHKNKAANLKSSLTLRVKNLK